MADPELVSLAQKLATAVLLLLGGGVGVKGYERLRRNGNAGRDAQHIISALQKEGRETRTVMRDNNQAINDLRLALAERHCPFLQPGVPPQSTP